MRGTEKKGRTSLKEFVKTLVHHYYRTFNRGYVGLESLRGAVCRDLGIAPEHFDSLLEDVLWLESIPATEISVTRGRHDEKHIIIRGDVLKG